MSREDISNIQAEAGVVNTLVYHPEFAFNSEHLKPEHFTDSQNAALYAAISALAHDNIMQIDAFNILNKIKNDETLVSYRNELKQEQLKEFVDMADVVARHDLESYMMLVNAVLDAALRRDLYGKLKECESLCFKEGQQDIEQKVYGIVDQVLMGYAIRNDIPQFKDIVDDVWADIVNRQSNAYVSIPFKFPTLNEYVRIEPGELVIFGAGAKEGKSMMLLNCAVDLLRRSKKVLYLDSELNTRLFTCRLMANLAKLPFRTVRDGTYNLEELNRINKCIGWMKSKSFTHIYMPIMDAQNMYTIFKKVYHTQGVDVIIVDYIKSSGEGDAFNSYQELGKLVDNLKNTICGSMNVAGLAAAQATSTGKLADSAKIARNASTIIMITPKSNEEIQRDGEECGNKKMFVAFNRNGMQMTDGEYIDLKFNGDYISYEEAKQHEVIEPW